ncbi:MBL fold metallo-hydrolase [Yoonia sp.]|uniref:MBL fold metallo-hydrolase n=1 Tax=Yoonia sp. TaxID=2212373 RepID=UPI003976A99B
MNVEFEPIAGRPHKFSDDLKVLLAPNPSAMTYWGTNTYILGRETLAIIDPGPDNPAHLDALETAIAGRPVSHILLTHSHLDHSPLAIALSARTDAPVYAFGNSLAGRSVVMQQLVKDGFAGGGEGIDHHFKPDHTLHDSDVLKGAWGEITALHTPGHIGNHLCFVWKNVIFTGDHVMGWASSLVSPPDGDLTDFMLSCARLKEHPADVYYPGHGAPVSDPSARLDWLIAHRKRREAQILNSLARRSAIPSQIAAEIYHDVAPDLLRAAERNVFAHLIDLVQRGTVTATPRLSAAAVFALTQGR